MTTLSRAEMIRNFEQQMSDYARGERLKELREARHLSQEDAAHEIGITSKSLRTWEKGGPIKWENAKAAAKFYRVKPEELVSREAVVAAEESVAGVPVPYKTADVARAIAMDKKLDALLSHFEIEWIDPEEAFAGSTEALKDAKAAATTKKRAPRKAVRNTS